MSTQAFGVIGLEVMGRNVAQNIERNGFPVAVFNRTWQKTEDFMHGPAEGKNFKAGKDMKEFCALISKPRRILMLVKAGFATDSTIESIKPYLEPSDILIDGGNALYTDTERRAAALAPSGVKFFGMGVSGGEEGALWGPSLMPGGDPEAYKILKPVLEKIAAKAPADQQPCVAYCGSGGAGHFVKMLHNGIEYGDMQLIAESYDLMRNVAGLGHEQLQQIFTEWNKAELQSFLIEITSKVINFPDPAGSGKPLVEVIQDKVGMKGTGTWAIKAGLDLQVPVPTIAAAVDAREISMLQSERAAAEKIFPAPKSAKFTGDAKSFVNDVKAALYCSKICSYAQGMAVLAAANRPKPPAGGELDSSTGHAFGIRLDEMARIWRAGCIIRARFLDDITQTFRENSNLPNLLTAPKFSKMLLSNVEAWRRVIALGVQHGIATPAFSASLAYFDAYRRARLPGQLIQAQRDFFGGHTYQRYDKPGTFHTEWDGSGQEFEVVAGKARTGTDKR
jgi:6-phosphogluconate dehydrogenase